MNYNERPWSSQRQPQRGYYYDRQPYYNRPQPMQPRPPIAEETLQSRDLQIERKDFRLILKENPRGRFLRITEGVGGRINSIIVPASGLRDFQKLLEEMVAAAETMPAQSQQPQPQ